MTQRWLILCLPLTYFTDTPSIKTVIATICFRIFIIIRLIKRNKGKTKSISYLHLISNHLNMFPYLIQEYVVQYRLMVNIIHIHDEDNEVRKIFDHESKIN
jgi:hypothetical protein